MAGGYELPKRMFVHGHLLFENDKISKSRGKIVRAEPIRQVMGADPMRYFLLREVVFGQDGNFSYDALVGRYNSDLANGLGNLASRTLTMIGQYRQGAIPASAGDPDIAAAAAETIRSTQAAFDRFEFSKGLENIWSLISAVDKFIVQHAPWKLARQQEEAARTELDLTLYTSAEALRIVTALLYPVMPELTPKIWQQLGMPEAIDNVRLVSLEWGGLAAGQKIGEISAVFPRLEAKDVIEKMRTIEDEVTAYQASLFGKTADAPPAVEETPKIAIDDFLKVDIRVALILTAQPVKNSTKLMHLTVDAGEGKPRTIVAGIAEAYTPEQLINRKVAIVANLAPRKLKGIESNGMIVAASVGDGKPVLVGFHEDIPVGARLK
jgi:methionyl-tRNA synthetase